MSTIRKVASDANVSIATVSRVLNNNPGVSQDVRNRVLESVNRCGYVANVGRRATSFLAWAYTGPSSWGSAYDAAICEGLASAMDESELDLVLLNVHRDKRAGESYTQFFLRKGVRGVLLWTTKRTRDVCEQISEEGFPALVLGDKFEDSPVDYIYCDSHSTSMQGMEHLIALGHRRIALAISDIIEDSDHADRLTAYETSLREASIELDRKLYFHVPASRPDGAQIIRSMMSMAEPPTAVFVTDPSVAVGALNECHKLGISVPDDLSVLGFDDTDVRYRVYPNMTAVCQDARRLGYEAFKLLSPNIGEDNHSKTIQETYGTWLEINGTTGQPSSKRARFLPDVTRMAVEN